MSFAGWLWADLLLGLFAIFALATSVGQVGAPASVATSAPPPSVAPAVSAAPVAQAAPRPIGLAPNPLEMTLPVDGPAILSGDPRRASVEQSRVAAEVARAIGEKRVALVLAYGSHADARAGDRLAELATAGLRGGIFGGAAVRAFHNIVSGDPGSALQLRVFFFQE